MIAPLISCRTGGDRKKHNKKESKAISWFDSYTNVRRVCVRIYITYYLPYVIAAR